MMSNALPLTCARCEVVVSLADIGRAGRLHPLRIDRKNWHCNECKSCTQCGKSDITLENRLITCEECDRAFHMACVQLYGMPLTGWACRDCRLLDRELRHANIDDSRTKSAKSSKHVKLSSASNLVDGGKRAVKSHRKSNPTDGHDQSLVSKSSSRRQPTKQLPAEAKKSKKSSSPAGHGDISTQLVHQKESVVSEKDVHDSAKHSVGMATRPRSSSPVAKSAGKRQRALPTRYKDGAPMKKRNGSGCTETKIKALPKDLAKHVGDAGLALFYAAKNEADAIIAADNAAGNASIANISEKWITIGGTCLKAISTDSPLPPHMLLKTNVYFCDTCLSMLSDEEQYFDHIRTCRATVPPGERIYTDGSLQMHEIDGELGTIYCQNLCLFSRFFLTSKSLCYDVGVMLFYVLTQAIGDGRQSIIGYFSREKAQNSSKTPNLSCVLVLPHYANKGFGKMLIDLSYVISRREQHPGGPEHPLSPAGLVAYAGYWSSVVANYLRSHMTDAELNVKQMALDTGIAERDILSTLVRMDLIKTISDSGTNELFIVKPDKKSNEFEAALKKYQQMKKANRFIKEDKIKKHWVPPRMRFRQTGTAAKTVT